MAPPIPSSTARLSRRGALVRLLGIGVGVTTTLGCSGPDPSRPLALVRQHPDGDAPDAPRYADALDALADVLLPAERDAQGMILVPGAREAKVDRVLDAGRFGPLAVALGFVPALPAALASAVAASGDAVRALLNAELDALASLERPFTGFAALPADLRETIVARSLDDDDAMAPAILLVRAACFAAYLGAVASDAGLAAVGLPAYEDFDDGLAISGYPRRKSDGMLLDPTRDDLDAIARKGDLDDYTYAQAPAPTPGDDLALVLDDNGDLR